MQGGGFWSGSRLYGLEGVDVDTQLLGHGPGRDMSCRGDPRPLLILGLPARAARFGFSARAAPVYCFWRRVAALFLRLRYQNYKMGNLSLGRSMGMGVDSRGVYQGARILHV